MEHKLRHHVILLEIRPLSGEIIMSEEAMNRRNFLKRTGQAALALPVFFGAGGCLGPVGKSGKKTVRFGLCADVHKGVIHDAELRMQTFVDRMNAEQVDFVMQLGDFCSPYYDNKVETATETANFLAIWNSFSGPKYHVCGNHDIDDEFTWEETMAFWGQEKQYFSFDRGSYHFVVLDANEKRGNAAPGYPRYIGNAQAKWLQEDLAATRLNTFVFSHQSLENSEGVENREEIRAILEQANQRSDSAKVVACFSGHHHIDYHTLINGINYIQINSMSYQWLGGDYIHARFSPEVEAKNPWVRYTVPYKDPLYAIVTLEQQGVMKIEGISSEYIPPTPRELGKPEEPEGNKSSAVISDRVLSFKA